jgi:hypothetical protein
MGYWTIHCLSSTGALTHNKNVAERAPTLSRGDTGPLVYPAGKGCHSTPGRCQLVTYIDNSIERVLIDLQVTRRVPTRRVPTLPAGFVYIYAALAKLTGGGISVGQTIFVAVYVVHLAVGLALSHDRGWHSRVCQVGYVDGAGCHQ